MTGIWQTGMILWCAGLALFGLVLSLGAIPATSGLVRFIFAALGHPHQGSFGSHLRFLLAVMGPITIGWALTILGLVLVAPALPPEPAVTLWAWVTAGALAWFVADSLLSVQVGFARNLFPNLLLVVTYLGLVLGSGVLGI